MDRRNFIARTTAAVGVSTFLPITGKRLFINSKEASWESVRSDFLLTREGIQMAQFLLSSHPATVRQAIEKHSRRFDEDPSEYWHNAREEAVNGVLKAAADYLKCAPEEIALTDSTTMGLAILYSGLKLNQGDHILTSTHDHYSTEKSLEFAVNKNGASMSSIDLYKNASSASVDEILGNLKAGIRDNTRIVAVTYVHSITGVKLPLARMSRLIKEINQQRDEKDRIYFCVDCVHGFGVEDITVDELGIDFLVAGTHKWLFGPRGTGIVWARKDAWHMVDPIIPPFSEAYLMWMGVLPERPLNFFEKITPGGFHSFEYRWALKEAFEYHMQLGKEKIQNRTHELNTLIKQGMQENSRIKLHTPMSSELSSGINSFEVKGMSPQQAVLKLRKMDIYGSTTPYKTIYARLTPCILNTEAEVMACIKALEEV